MRKTQKTLIKLGIIIVICIISTLGLLIYLLNRNKLPEQGPGEKIPDSNTILEGEKIKELEGISSYFNLKYCIQNYYTAASNLKYSSARNASGITRTDGLVDNRG